MNIKIAHLVGHNPAGRVEHIIAIPESNLERPSVIITEDGKVWMYGSEYRHFPNTCFYLQVQPAFFSKKMMSVLTKAVPRLERNRAA